MFWNKKKLSQEIFTEEEHTEDTREAERCYNVFLSGLSQDVQELLAENNITKLAYVAGFLTARKIDLEKQL